MPFMTAPFLGQAGFAPCVADFPVIRGAAKSIQWLCVERMERQRVGG